MQMSKCKFHLLGIQKNIVKEYYDEVFMRDMGYFRDVDTTVLQKMCAT